MSEEYDDPQGQVLDDPQGQVEEQQEPDWKSMYEAEQHRAQSVDGRLRQVNESLSASGYAFDPNTNAVIQRGGYQQPQSAPQEETNDDIIYDAAAARAYIQSEAKRQATEMNGQMMQTLMPMMDNVIEYQLKADHPDWQDIKTGVMETAKNFGVYSVAQLQANPEAFKLLVNAERGKRASVQSDPQKEIERLQRIVSAQSAGRSAVSASQNSASDLDDTDRAYMKEHNMTEDQYDEITNGPARVRFGGNK